MCFLCVFSTGEPCRDRLILPLFLNIKTHRSILCVFWAVKIKRSPVENTHKRDKLSWDFTQSSGNSESEFLSTFWDESHSCCCSHTRPMSTQGTEEKPHLSRLPVIRVTSPPCPWWHFLQAGADPLLEQWSSSYTLDHILITLHNR